MATWLSGISKHHRTIRKNILVWCGLYLLIFLLVLGWLCWLQVVNGRYYRSFANRYHTRDVLLPHTRGRLLDHNHKVLALDDQRESLFVDPSLIPGSTNAQRPHLYAEFIARELAPVIQRPESEVLAALTAQLTSVSVKRDLTPVAVQLLRQLSLPGVQVVTDGTRYAVQVDARQLTQGEGVDGQLAEALGLSRAQFRKEMGLPASPQGSEEDDAIPLGIRTLSQRCSDETRRRIEDMHFDGIHFLPDGPSYALIADPRQFNDASATVAAETLAPALEMRPESIKRRLLARARFCWLRRGLPVEVSAQVLQLQGTMFVVEPGLLSDAPGADDEGNSPLQEAVDRLYDMLNDPKDRKTGLTPPERISRDEIRRRLLPGATPGVLAEKLNDGEPSIAIARRLFAKSIPGVVYGLPGVGMQRERRRHYPFDTLASATLGFVAYPHDHALGAFGLEASQEKTLRGTDGHEAKEIDARHITIPGRSKRVEPVDGHDTILTLDLDIQEAAETELAKAVQQAKALRGQCIVLDPSTGEILAMATYPNWNPNNLRANRLPLVNPAISNYYEPGSTFKVVAVMAALEEGLIRDGKTITYCSGALGIGRRTIHEAHNAHGTVDCARLLEQSCNIGAATLALKLNPTHFIKWCELLGFGQRTGIELANESLGSLNKRNVKAKITLANMGFGQGLAVTPIQMAAAYSVIANGGEWIQPHLVKARVTGDGTIEEVTVPRRRVCSPETAKLMQGYLERVVTVGTGNLAAIPGYRVGGKTGTAQKVGERGYGSGKAIGSFIGFMPVENPRLTIVAVIDEPKGSHYGGVVAAPVVREVGRRALQSLHIPPTLTTPPAHQ